MTFLIAMTIGIATGAMRSIFAIAVVSTVLLASGIFMLTLHGPFTLMDLLMALIGYHVGLINCLIMALTMSGHQAVRVTLQKTTASPISDHRAKR